MSDTEKEQPASLPVELRESKVLVVFRSQLHKRLPKQASVIEECLKEALNAAGW